jgi:Fe-S cluster assembly iron-binding protein IscA
MAYISDMSETEVISMTATAARRVAEIATKLGKDPVLRLSVEGGGCSGFQYRSASPTALRRMTSPRAGASLVVGLSPDLVRGSGVDFVESLGGKASR